MALDAAAIRRIAKLARIHVEDQEVRALEASLNGILAYVEQLDEVDVSGVQPLAGGTMAGTALRFRADVLGDGGLAEKILANAPDREGMFFAVPKVVE